jgi:hypothetical protein
MKDEQHLERIYDLVEMFDFNNLSETDKEFVIKHITLKEYTDLRSTIKDSVEFFSKYPENMINQKRYHWKKIALYPIELYKIAAAILLIISAVSLLSKWDNSKHQNLIAGVDTVFVKKTDTLLVYVGDTIVKIKELTQNKNIDRKENDRIHKTGVIEKIVTERDCSKELCPKDIQKLSTLKCKNDFSNDKNLTDFIVSIN